MDDNFNDNDDFNIDDLDDFASDIFDGMDLDAMLSQAEGEDKSKKAEAENTNQIDFDIDAIDEDLETDDINFPNLSDSEDSDDYNLEELLANSMSYEESTNNDDSQEGSEADDQFSDLGLGGFDDLFDDSEMDFIENVDIHDSVEREDRFKSIVEKTMEDISPDMEDGEYHFDTISDTHDIEEKSAIRKKLDLFRPESLYPLLTGVLAVIVLLAGIAGFFVISQMQAFASLESDSIKSAESIKQPSTVTNGTSSIYLSATPAFFKLDIVELAKLTANTENTEFTFKYDVGWNKYNIKLIDSKNREYALMPISREEGNYGNFLRFEPLKLGIKGILLTIEEISTGEIVEFPYRFNDGLKVIPAKYLDRETTLVEDESSKLKLLNASFTNNSTNITFMIELIGTAEFGFDNIYLSSGTKRVWMKEGSLSSWPIDDNKNLFSANFGVLSDLSEKWDINFTGAYNKYTTNLILDTTSLFKNNKESQMVIGIGDNAATLERMGIMGPLYVLVGFATDAEGNRVQADYISHINLRDDEGNKYVVEGDCRTGEIGADIIFDTRNIKDYNEIKGLAIENLCIESIQIKRDDLSANANLDKSSRNREANTTRAINNAKSYLREDGAESIELVFYYWEDRDFIGEFHVFEDGNTKIYLVLGENTGTDFTFSKTIVE